jgi:hypothetical protein
MGHPRRRDSTSSIRVGATSASSIGVDYREHVRTFSAAAMIVALAFGCTGEAGGEG